MRTDVYWIEGSAGRLGVMPRPRGGDWLADEVQALKAQGADVVVSLLEPEEVTALDLAQEGAECERAGLDFVSFPIRDRDVPASGTAASAFIRALAGRITEGSRVVVHCRQGVGRAGLVAACVLIVMGQSVTEALDGVTSGTRMRGTGN